MGLPPLPATQTGSRRLPRNRARLRNTDRLLFVRLHRLWPVVLNSFVIVQPETVVPLVSTQLQGVLEIEILGVFAINHGLPRKSVTYPQDKPRQCTLARTPYPWRVPEAPHRYGAVDSGQVPGAGPAANRLLCLQGRPSVLPLGFPRRSRRRWRRLRFPPFRVATRVLGLTLFDQCSRDGLGLLLDCPQHVRPLALGVDRDRGQGPVVVQFKLDRFVGEGSGVELQNVTLVLAMKRLHERLEGLIAVCGLLIEGQFVPYP